MRLVAAAPEGRRDEAGGAAGTPGTASAARCAAC